MAKKGMNKRKGMFLVVLFLLINVAYATSDPIDIRESNINDRYASISWLTSSEVTGWVNYSDTPADLSNTAYDLRGAGTVNGTHWVELDPLVPGVTYYYDITSNGTIYDNGGSHYTFTTGPVLVPVFPEWRFGSVLKADGATPASGVIVYLHLTDGDGAGSSGDSSLKSYLITDADVGTYRLDIVSTRLQDLSSYFSYSPAGDDVDLMAYAAFNEDVGQVVDTSVGIPPNTLPDMVLPGTPPVIAPAIPDITFDEDRCNDTVDLDEYVNDDDEPDGTLTWSSSGNVNVVVDVDAGTHVVNFSAAADWYGAETITLMVTDSGGMNDTDTILVTVNPVNDAPVVDLSALNLMTILENNYNDTNSLSDYVTDVDNPDSEINWSCTTDSTNLTAATDNNTKILNLSAGLVGVAGETVQVTCTATDPDGLSDVDSFNVNVLEVNDPPVIAPAIPDITFDEDLSNATVDLDDYVSDEEDADAALIWSVSGNTHVHVTIPAGHVANFTADADWYGAETITLTVTDTGSGTAPLSDSDIILVTVNPVNDAPVVDLSSADGLRVDEGTSQTIDLSDYVTDVDNPDSEINWSCTTNSTNLTATANNNTKILDLTAAANSAGESVQVDCTATDPGSLSDTSVFSVDITNASVNDAPIIISTPITAASPGVLYTYDVDASDPDAGDVLTYSLLTNPSGMSINPSSGLISWTPTIAHVGNQPVEVQVRDSGNLTDNQSFNVIVAPSADTTPPIQSQWSPASGSTVRYKLFTLTFRLNESGDCKWSLTDQNYSAMTEDCSGDGTTHIACPISGLDYGTATIYTACRDIYGNEDDETTNTGLTYNIRKKTDKYLEVNLTSGCVGERVIAEVIDGKSEKPLEDVMVAVYSGHGVTTYKSRVARGYTNESGIYDEFIPDTAGEYTMVFEKSGYPDEQYIIDVCNETENITTTTSTSTTSSTTTTSTTSSTTTTSTTSSTTTTSTTTSTTTIESTTTTTIPPTPPSDNNILWVVLLIIVVMAGVAILLKMRKKGGAGEAEGDKGAGEAEEDKSSLLNV